MSFHIEKKKKSQSETVVEFSHLMHEYIQQKKIGNRVHCMGLILLFLRYVSHSDECVT